MVIGSIEKGSPAENADLKKYDVITELDGQPIESSAELQAILYQKEIGDKMDMTFYRDGAKKKTTVTLDQDSSKLLEKKQKEAAEQKEKAESEKSIFNQ